MKQEKTGKIRTLKILEILRQESDEDHYISTPEIISKLAVQGIECDRRTLYDDIAVLNEYGYEILCEKHAGKANAYCVADRSFDMPELRILMDAVQAASFITPKKTAVFLDKIAELGGSHRAELLKHNIVNFNTIKHTNEQIFYSVSEIERGIIEGKKVSFFYFDYNYRKEKVFRKNKSRYLVNPYATIFSNDNYYLACSNEKYDNIAYYRIDRMENVIVEEEDRRPTKDKAYDLLKGKKGLFEMFVGETKRIKLAFDAGLMDSIVDKFGEDAHYADLKDGRVELIAEVQVSGQFFAWACKFGDSLEIIAPTEVREQFVAYIEAIDKLYSKNK